MNHAFLLDAHLEHGPDSREAIDVNVGGGVNVDHLILAATGAQTTLVVVLDKENKHFLHVEGGTASPHMEEAVETST
jgi:hypothetical protein